ncbi:MAG: CAP domain-containing protein [Desulfovibrio sp.]|nr:CAP domain-containing protein [Desulfovibrio sp.]
MTRKNLLFSLLILLPLMTLLPVLAVAAEDQTVLYYLIEMQRRVTKKCQGKAMPEAPSLTPSESLREAAQNSLDGIASLAPAADAPLIYLKGRGAKPQQVFNSLAASQCRELMGQGYRYIGAAGRDERWVVILSAADKKPEAGSFSSGRLDPESENAVGGSAPEKAGGNGLSAGRAASGGKNAGAEQTGRQNTVLSMGQYGPNTVKPGTEPHEPASPRVIGEVSTDARGRPVGPIVFYDKGKSALGALPASGNDPGAPGQTAAPSTPANSGGAYAGSYAGPAPAPSTPSGGYAGSSGLPSASGSGGTYGGDYAGQGAPFVPPSGPGPFAPPAGMPATPAAPRAGVVPLADTRPPGSEEPLVYVAPGHEKSGADPAGFADPAPQTLTAQSPAPARTGSPAPASGAGGNLLALINAERARGRMCGNRRMPSSQALQANPILARVAQNQAEDMNARSYFSSTTPEGVTPGQRLSEAGYVWSFIAENIARMGGGAEAVLRGWLNVESRCENIMGAEYFEAGVGYDPAGRNWVLTLATPAP